MQELITFLSSHAALTAGVVIIFILLMIVELLRAKRTSMQLSPTDAIYKINREQAVIIDIRPKDSYSQGHIIDALSIPISNLSDTNKRLEKWRSKPLIVVCQNGLESQKVATRLLKEGFTAYTIRGGMSAWVNAKLPIVKE